MMTTYKLGLFVLTVCLLCPFEVLAQSGSRSSPPSRSYRQQPSRSYRQQPTRSYRQQPSRSYRQSAPSGSSHRSSPPAGSTQRAPTGSTQRAPAGSNQREGSGPRGHQSAKVAMEGYCPVCIIDLRKWIKGKPEYATTYDGKTYLFPSQEVKDKFLANPVKYIPALGGDCTVCLNKMQQRQPGNIRHATFYQDRLFLFPSNKEKGMFKANPEAFAQVDLAAGGDCVVCQVELNKQVPGSPEFATLYQGRRYLFPSDEQRQMFLANPGKYVSSERSAPQGSTGRQATPQGSTGRQAAPQGSTGRQAAPQGSTGR